MPPVEGFAGFRLVDSGGEDVPHARIVAPTSAFLESEVKLVRVAGGELFDAEDAE